MRMKWNRRLPLFAALAVAAFLLAPTPAAAHQCVDVAVTNAPASAAAGSQILVSGTLTNCGDPAPGFQASWILAGRGRRITLLEKLVVAAPGETVTLIDTLSIPSDLEPGAYTLSLKGVAPSGFTDTDSVAITID